MATVKLKSDLHKLIDSIDDTNVLKAVHTILSRQDEVIGYTVKGVPITASDLRKKVKEASQRVKSGNFVSHSDLKKQIAKW